VVENTLGHNGEKRDGATATLQQWLLIALAGVVMAVMVATLIARLTGYQADSIPDSTVVEVRELGFRDLPRGVVEVFEWNSDQTIAFIPAGEGSFVRGVVRSLVRQRRGLDSGVATRFELARHNDGRLVLSDPETGESIDLIAFGPTNVASFAELIDTPVPMEPAGPLDSSW
jgi:putative photosynthetic complex assembly protein